MLRRRSSAEKEEEMQSVWLAVAALACPVGMGVMMWIMGRGMRRPRRDPHSARTPSLAALRDEHRRLGEQIDQIETDGSQQPSPARR
jgi:hypothetical protein